MLQQEKERFERTHPPQESALLEFEGVDGYDVYNCSTPFYMAGKWLMYGRVERRAEWSRSRTFLFESIGQDRWRRLPGSSVYPLEDPYVTCIGGELVLGGVHVLKGREIPATYYNYFYRGQDPNDLYYFETGPADMKDIRLVELPQGRIGVFSRPRGDGIMEKYGCFSMMGYTQIDSLDELDARVIEEAPYIPDVFGKGEWGGANQVHYLDSGLIGIIGHQCYHGPRDAGMEKEQEVYVNVAFIFDPSAHRMIDRRILACRSVYPPYPSKRAHISDCVFTGGIVARPDGLYDLYTGVGDTREGRTVIPYPYEGYGHIVNFGEKPEVPAKTMP